MAVHFKQITRVNPATGAVERPWRNRSHQFLLGDPAAGAARHHDEHAVKIDNYGEALELVERGFSIRMSDATSPPSLVAPRSLTFVDEPVARIDELWTYTMPSIGFDLKDLERDISRSLLCQSAEIYWLANKSAADAFIGFELDIDEVESAVQAERIDLAQFNFARVAVNAYGSAFRIGSAGSLSDDDADELELLIGATFSGASRRHTNPVDRPDSLLRATMLSAYLRWQIADGCFTTEKLNQSLVENLAILSKMTEQGVRNSLNKEGLSSKGEVHHDSILRWLEHRRDFVPLREDERPQSRPTWRALHDFKTLDLASAFAAVRSRSGISATADRTELHDYEGKIALSVKRGEVPLLAHVREYARHLDLNIDTFVVQFCSLL